MSEDIKPELIEKAANAVRHERAYIAAAAFGVPLDAVGECAGTIARAVLSAVADDLRSEGAALADEVERLRAEPAEAEIEAAAEAITAHSTLSHPCEGGERCCDECGEAFGWRGIDRTEEGHRYAIHRARKALAAAQEARSHDHHGPRGGR